MTEQTLTVRMPLAVKNRGGRKVVVAPEITISPDPAGKQSHAAFVRALAKAFWHQRVLESGDYHSIQEPVKAAGVNASYLSRMLRLAPPPPSTVEAVLQGRRCPSTPDV